MYLCIYKHSLLKVTGISDSCGLLTQIRKVFSVPGSLCCNRQQWELCRHRRKERAPGLANRPHIPLTKSYFYSRKKVPMGFLSFFYRVEGNQNYYTVLTALKHYSCNR